MTKREGERAKAWCLRVSDLFSVVGRGALEPKMLDLNDFIGKYKINIPTDYKELLLI